VNKSGFMVTPSRFVKESFLKQKVDTINTKKAFDDYQKLSTSPGEIEEHEEEVLIYDDYRGIPVLGTHSYVPEMQWFVISEIDKKEAFESLDIIRNFYIIVLIAILIIVFLIGTYIARRISKPIEKLQEGVKIIGDGNLDYKVGTDTQDEIGHLSKMFDRMTENLKQTTASRDDLNREIAERKKAEEKLKENEKKLHSLSITDELTGLYNRRGFFTLAEQQLKQSIRDKKGIYLVLADVDHLKRINDNLGHHEGDVVLIKTANLLKESFRESDIIARIGGDEFVILVNETPETTIDTITVRLKENIKAYNNTKSKNYEISLSIGVIHCSSEEPCNLEELIIKADKLMYTEKKQKF
jgi:diguanylate cyclase (GGDEF)-like protein